GGVLRYGIPSFRLPRDIIDREVKRLTDLGVRIETNKVIGKTFTIPQLLEEKGFDAAFVGVGAGSPAFLGIPGEFAGQVYSANEFLTRVTLMGGDQFPLRDTPGLDLDKRGNIVADEGGTQSTSLRGVFAGGDIVTGGATVILAMGAGRRAARAIATYLKTGKTIWPVTREQADGFVPPVPI